MNRLVALKLKSGEDLIGVLNFEDDNLISIGNPMEVNIDPVHGFYVRSFLLLTKSNAVQLIKDDIIFIDDANDKAISYYEEFNDQLSKGKRTAELQDTEDFESELEEVFTAMIESKNTKLH